MRWEATPKNWSRFSQAAFLLAETVYNLSY